MPSTSGPSTPGSVRLAEALPSANRYRIVERLARGGMGEVMLAYDELVCRDVVIKRMLDPKPAADAVERFLREARLQGRLDHPSIVPVHEIAVEDSGAPYFVMKRLNGTTLSKIIKHEDERFTSRRLLRAFADISLAIEYAHVRGIVHRDIKPANIMLGDFGEVWMLDWGVAKLVGDIDTRRSLHGRPGASQKVTGTLGTMNLLTNIAILGVTTMLAMEGNKSARFPLSSRRLP